MSEFSDPTSANTVSQDESISKESNEEEKETKEDDGEKKDTFDTIAADIAYVKANIVKAAVLTVTRDYITVVIM